MARILLVEDDQFLRDLYSELLIGEGYTVLTAEDGEVALQMLQQNEHAHDAFDLVLLDIMLPKKDGLALLKELTSEQKQKAGQIVLLTNLGQEAIIKEGFDLGAVGYLIKSALAPDQVLTEVQNFLGSAKHKEKAQDA